MATILYELPKSSVVSLIVYDVLGREVPRLADSYLGSGSHQVEWEGEEFPSSIYIARLVTSGYAKSIKMLLLK